MVPQLSGSDDLMAWGGADIIIIEIKYTINVVVLNHTEIIPPPWCVEKLSSTKSVPGAKNGWGLLKGS